MRTRTYKVYKFNELTDEQKQKALEKNYYINVEGDWWDCTYEDAKNIGLKIEAFDIDRGSYCKGSFIASVEECAHMIEKEHGEQCDTYITAKSFLKKRDEIVDTWERDENGDFINEYGLETKLDELGVQFEKDLLEDYRICLQKEYEYQTSKEAIIETFEANNYDFTEEGKID